MLRSPGFVHGRDCIDKIRHGVVGGAEQSEPLPHSMKVLRLPQGRRIAVAAHQALEAAGRSLDDIDVEIIFRKAMFFEEGHGGQGHGPSHVSHGDASSLELLDALVPGLGDEAVNGIVEFGDDRDRVGAAQGRSDQERGRHMRHIGLAFLKGDQTGFGAAHDLNHLEVEAVGCVKTLLVGNAHRQRKNAAPGRGRLRIAQLQKLLGWTRLNKKERAKQSVEQTETLKDLHHGLIYRVFSRRQMTSMGERGSGPVGCLLIA